MRSIEEFHAYFESELKHYLNPLENYRISRLKQFKKYRNIGVGLGIIVILSFYTQIPILIVSIFLLCLFFLGLAYESINKTNSALQIEYKKKIIPKILGFIYSEFEYYPQQKISKTIFEKSLLFEKEISYVNGEDYMRFLVDGVDLMFCESEVFNYVPGTRMFKGVFISATFNKSFSSKTFVFPEKNTSIFRKMKFKILGASFRVKLEDPDFEKEFIVLSEDQVESRFILTTSLMQRILDYKKKLKAEIAFSFISNRLYCSIPNPGNLFEPVISESFLDFDSILKTYEPVILYTGIINDLNLNLKIWLK